MEESSSLIRDITESFRQLHLLCERFILEARTQGIYTSSELMTGIIKHLKAVLDDLPNLIAIGDSSLKQTNKNYMIDIGTCLTDIFRAQQQEDHLLEADYVEKMLLLQVEKGISFLRTFEPNLDQNTFRLNFDYNVQCLAVNQYKISGFDRLSDWESIEGSNDRLADVGTRLEVTRSGFYTFRGKDAKGEFYFHGNGNPCFDGELLSQKYYHPACRHYLIYGLGLGYHIKALAQLDDGARYDVYEVSKDTILAAFMSDRLDWLWNQDNIRLHYDPMLTSFADNVRKVRKYSVDSETSVMIHFPSIREIENETVREYMEELFVSDNSLRTQGKMMRTNHRENMKNCDPNILSQKNAFAGKKAIIVAGGPSLDANIERLGSHCDQYVILAVGTVYRKLMRMGIKPDYVMIADANKGIGKQFEGLWEEKIPVLVLSTAYLGVARKYRGEKYLLCHQDMKEDMLHAGISDQPLFESGGSVSTLALDFCIRMECKEIAFIGLDLAYTNHMTHAEGTPLRESIAMGGEFEREGYKWVHQGEGWNLEKNLVSTARNFILYQKWIEDRVRRDDVTMPVYDATEGGVLLHGLKPIRLAEYLEVQPF